ncbi:hypothetical protein IW261DRAFT_1509107 [Armillaria novae-zelandiae]|uniref:F-box domain-containing protein n=1 Tax=Armillaria novae-zelandiae TaxID=153914 RepID=A0AA39NV28_9AGAR|nr:hypothetical protein IW261DRAFT_1509107 [Armillaria novae-zelandiae]
MALPTSSLPCTGCDCPNHSNATYFGRDTSTHPVVDTSARVDLAHLKRSNEAPSEGEADALRDIMSSCQRRRKGLDEEESSLRKLIVDLKRLISSSKQRLTALQNEQLEVDAQIQEWKPLLNPIRCIPLEIWSQIFDDTVEFPTFPSASWTPDLRHGAMPRFRWNFNAAENPLWTLEGVCGKWKGVVLGSPQLWSSINIVITDSNFGPNAHQYVRRLGQQLGRSGKHPLSIIISCPEPTFLFDELPPQLIMMLYSFSDSIRDLLLYLPSRMLATIPSLNLSLPSLQTLFILSTDAGIIDEPLELFPFCPQLRELEFVDVNNPIHYFSLPWKQVTNYRCWYYRTAGPDTSAHVSNLERMISLRDCGLQCNLPSPILFTNRVMVSCLRRDYRLLDLRSDGDDGGQAALRQVMDRLTLPQLLQLKVTCPEINTQNINEGAFAAVRRLIDRSLPPLTVLHFCGEGIATEDLRHVISSLHTLEDFQLTGLDKDTITTEVVKAFMLHPSSGVINIPRLRILHLSGVAKAGVCLLVDMIGSRWILKEGSSNAVSRLKSVKIDTDYDFLGEYSHMTNEAHNIGGWIKEGLVCEFSRYV